VALVDRHGTKVGEEHYGAWVGTLRVVAEPIFTGKLSRTFLWLGTKAGDVVCAEIVPTARSRYRLDELYRFTARNTIREIAISQLGPGDPYVAAGSEDRCVYLFNHARVVSGGQVEPVRYETNGWIRSVTFCRSPGGERLIAAGCGDKRLHFLTTDGAGAGDVWIGAKIHSIAADERSSRVYSTSDARKLDIVGWRGDALRVQHSVDLAHRATRLIWADENNSALLAVCEDATIYSFDLRSRTFSSHLAVGERVFSAKVVDKRGPRSLMLGLAGGRLLSCSYALERGLPPISAASRVGFTDDFDPASPERLAEVILYGPKTESVRIGIGRFIDIVPARSAAPAVCLVGTDQGAVAVIPMRPDQERQAVTTLDFHPERVWAVRGRRLDRRSVQVDVATSGRSVTSQTLTWNEAWAVSTTDKITLDLADWPREIRTFDADTPDNESLIVACENGDLVVTGRDTKFNTGEILRTAVGRAKEGTTRIVVGSDNNSVEEYDDDGQRRWRYLTRDRVREVLIEGDACVAVSEDRFLYRLGPKGELLRRFRFPHRALCVSGYPPVDGQECYVVGCGDGSVYVLEADGAVVSAYAFPDRIRDVRVVEERELVVACEDGNVYFAPVLAAFLEDNCPDHIDLVEETVQALRENAEGEVLALGALPADQKLLLLVYFESWCEHGDSELAIALLDAMADEVCRGNHPQLALAYARALLVLAERVSVPAALSRIERLVAQPDVSGYAVQALVVAMLRTGGSQRLLAEPQTRFATLVDAVLESVRLDDEWVQEESLRALAASGLLSATSTGFVTLGAAAGISFSVLNEMVASAREAAPAIVQSCGLITELKRLTDPDTDGPPPSERAAAFEEWEQGLAATRAATDRETAAEALQHWLQCRVETTRTRTWSSPSIESDFEDLRAGRARFRHVAEHFWNECLDRNPRLDGAAFISALAFRNITEALGSKYDAAAPKGNRP
jgi:hypothetical protein